MPDGQDLVLEFGSAVLDSMSVSPSEPCSSLKSLPCLEVFDDQYLDEYFDYDTPVTDISYHAQSDAHQTNARGFPIDKANSLDLSSATLDNSDIKGEHQTCASTPYNTPILPGITQQKYPLLNFVGTCKRMARTEETIVKVEADPTLNTFLTSEENLQSELKKFGPKPKQAKRRVKKSTAKQDNRHTYDREGLAENDSSIDEEATKKKRVTLSKNKYAAARCRVKKKEMVRSQNEELRSKLQENMVLQETAVELRTKAHWMAMMLAEHDRCLDGST